MAPFGQYVIVAAAILVAGAYLARRIWRRFTKADALSGCGTRCSGCAEHPTASATQRGNLVSLDSLASSIDSLKPPRN